MDQFNYTSEKEKEFQKKIEIMKEVNMIDEITNRNQLLDNEQIKKNNLDYVYKLLRYMKDKEASDMFITVGLPPTLKINGLVTPIDKIKSLNPEQTKDLVYSTMNDKQIKEFNQTNECNYAISLSEVGRFRVNAFRQRGSVGMVLRVITTIIPNLKDLNVPSKLENIVMEKRGLVIVVGATSSGKSTTLAAMIGHRNKNQAGHIITIEDPIEFVHQHEKSIVTQREIGVDTDNWENALKNTLRQAPDVILIGEIRDRETMEHAIAFSETGHLCLATLHANNANQALDRIINFFPEDRRNQLLMDLSLNLKSIISQRLIPRVSGKRIPAVEILLNSSRISDLIFKGDVATIKEAMSLSRDIGMQTFDQALFELYEKNEITLEDALRNADSLNDLRLEIKLHSKKTIENVENNLTIVDL